jgi:hypothetical protein
MARQRSRLLVALVTFTAAAIAGPTGSLPTAHASYSAASAGDGGSVAQLVPPGNTPSASAVSRDITVTWAPTSLTGGTPATGYLVRRYTTTGVEHAVLDECTGVVVTLSCTEHDVPTGSWRYTVTPLFGNWTGSPSVESAAVVTSAASLTLTTSTVSALPATLDGTIAGFTSDDSLTFHLDGEDGPLLSGTPSTVPSGGSAAITVTIPAGTDDSPHSVFAVGGDGTLASHPITVLDPPVLTGMEMRDVNANGKVDKVVVTFSKPLAPYSAGTTPWTLTNVPSSGTLSSVTVSGSTATLNLTEGGGAANTAVGTFKVALASNAAGIRDAANQTASFAATAPQDKAAPAPTSKQMLDVNGNGKVDQVTVAFSEPLASYTGGTTPWTLSATPSSGTLSSVAVAASTATLTLAEGAGAPDTAVGSFTVALATDSAGIADAAGNLASFAAAAPLDKAKPARLSMVINDVNSNGKIDRVNLTFSEPLATYTAGNTGWSLASPPSAATLASVSASGTTATLTLTEGAGAASTAVGTFKITLAATATGIRDSAGNLSSWASTAPTDGAKPILVSLNMNDANANGKVDQVTAVFTETLGTYTAGTTPWTLTGTPSGGTAASASVATTTATLTITEGAGAADTTVGAFTVALATDANGVKDPNGNQASFTTTTPLDKAKPARLSMAIDDVNANGKIDRVNMTFSEPLAAYTAGTTGWTLANAPSGATLASVTASGTTATLTLTEGVGAATTAVGTFKITLASNAAGIRDAAANLTSWASTAPTDGAKPVLLTLNMNDANANGKVDQVTAVFTETLGTYTAGTAPWTLSATPSGGTAASASVATTTATLTITEGAGAADTTVGAFTVALASDANGVKDVSGNQASFASTAPLDKAKPARLSMTFSDIDVNGKVDRVDMTFSEPLATYTAGTTGWTLASAPSGATLASVSASGTTASLTLTEGAGAASTAVGSFTVALAATATGIRDAAGNLSTWAAAAPTDRAAPVLLTLNMNDANANGKVDQVTAVFTETLGTYTAGTTPWTLAAIPSGGTLVSVAVATTTATLTITEGAAAADTSVGAFTVAMAAGATGVKDAAGNQASFATTTPLDKAKPARLSMAIDDVNANGKVDRVNMTFSEPLAAYTAGTAGWTFASAPSGSTLASVSTAGSTAALTLTEGAGAASTAVGSFKITLAATAGGIRDAAGNLTSWASTAPTDGAKPALLTLTMSDTTANGKVDRVVAVFSETLSSYTAGTAPWTLSGTPSSGTLASVSVSSATATLTITEGAGALDTAVGAFTVAMATSATGIRDAAANLGTFAATVPADAAGPVASAVTTTAGTLPGLMQAGDTLAITFSEPLAPATVPSSVTVTEADPTGAGNDTLTVSGITSGARNTGSDSYIALDGRIADFTSSIAALSGGNTTVTVTVAGTCSNTGCAFITAAPLAASLSFAPAATLTDPAANAAVGSRADVLKLF